MKREILFRGRTFAGRWIEGPSIQFIGQDVFIYPEIGYDCPGSYRVLPDTVGQYTGFTDKNGVKIFEGDVVETNDYSGGIRLVGNQKRKRCIVVFYKGGFVLNNPLIKLRTGEAYLGGTELSDTPEAHNTILIGNIHDNPELIEQPR